MVLVERAAWHVENACRKAQAQLRPCCSRGSRCSRWPASWAGHLQTLPQTQALPARRAYPCQQTTPRLPPLLSPRPSTPTPAWARTLASPQAWLLPSTQAMGLPALTCWTPLGPPPSSGKPRQFSLLQHAHLQSQALDQVSVSRLHQIWHAPFTARRQSSPAHWGVSNDGFCAVRAPAKLVRLSRARRSR